MEEHLDQPELADLLASHRTALHSYVSYRLDRDLRLKEPVSDIVQSALREVLANPGRFTYQGPEAFRAFLIRAVEHKIANKRRHWQSLKHGGPAAAVTSLDGVGAANRQAATPSEIAGARETLTRLLAAIEKLSEDDRKLLAMRRGAGLSPKVIAAELEVSVRTIQTRLARIMTFLARELGHGWEGASECTVPRDRDPPGLRGAAESHGSGLS